jgi:hypothetical protein
VQGELCAVTVTNDVTMGYVVGDTLCNLGTYSSYFVPMPVWVNNNTIGFTTGASSPWVSLTKSTGGFGYLTVADYHYRLIARRAW